MDHEQTFKADLHVHSVCSENPTAKSIRFFHGKESYTPPADVYAAARARGMDFVTITDHNTLNGSLAIAHLPGTFLGAELDTWFPENGCRVHVVALGLDERTFAEAMQAKASVYDLVACLREARVTHFLAHPLFDMTGKLTADVVEKMLLLFNVLEGRNGARVDRCNGLLRDIVASLTPEAIHDMAERQGIEPYGDTPWRKALTGGSDDHSGLFTAGAYTVAGGDGTPAGFLASIARGESESGGEDGDSRLLAHNIYAASFWRLREMLRLDEPDPNVRTVEVLRKGFGRIGRDVPLLEKAVRGVRSVAPGLYREEDGRGLAWEDLLEREVGSLLREPGGIHAVGSRELNRRIFTVAARLAGDVVSMHLERLADPRTRTTPRERLESGFAIGMVHFLELAYFIAYSFQTRDRADQEALRRHLLGAGGGTLKVAVFTDAPDEADGVSLSVRRLAETAGRRGVDLEIVTSSAAPTGPCAGGMNFQASAVRPLELAPDHPLLAPPILDVLDHVAEEDFTAIHVTTASGVGLVGLLAAKLLHLPVTGTVLGDLPGHAARLYPGSRAARYAWRYAAWFYSMLDEVFAPTREAARDLVAHGVDPRRVHVLPAAAAGGPPQPAAGAPEAQGTRSSGASIARPPRPAGATPRACGTRCGGDRTERRRPGCTPPTGRASGAAAAPGGWIQSRAMIGYIDTRGLIDRPRRFSEAILEGIAPGGGLFVPERLPAFKLRDITGLAALPYHERAARVYEAFGLDVSAARIAAHRRRRLRRQLRRARRRPRACGRPRTLRARAVARSHAGLQGHGPAVHAAVLQRGDRDGARRGAPGRATT